MHSNGSSPKRFNKVFHALLWSGLALVLMAASSLTLAGEAFVEGVLYLRIDSVKAERLRQAIPWGSKSSFLTAVFTATALTHYSSSGNRVRLSRRCLTVYPLYSQLTGR